MQVLSMDQAKELLGVPSIEGTPEQVDVLVVRVSELCANNGREWVAEHAPQLLDQWRVILDRWGSEEKI